MPTGLQPVSRRGPIKCPPENQEACTSLNQTQLGKWLGLLCPHVTMVLVIRKSLESPRGMNTTLLSGAGAGCV